MVKEIIAYGKKLLVGGRTPAKLTYASCAGIFIAFSPLIGLHWLLTILAALLFELNIGVIYAAAHVVNNPLTMVPVYLAGYAFGDFLLNWFFGTNLVGYNPSWMNWLNIKLSCLGVPNLSLWAFLIGGHLLGLIVSTAAYPFIVQFYKRILARPTSV